MKPESDVNRITVTREHRIGTRLITATGGQFQYAKIDFGVVGKIDVKTIHRINYMWIPKNGLAVTECRPFPYLNLTLLEMKNAKTKK